MKQTAVEWLCDLLESQKFITKSQIFIAKEMEKQQIIDARDSYINQILKINDDLLIYGEGRYKEMTSEQYYNETFKSE